MCAEIIFLIQNIEYVASASDILKQKGMFSELGEKWFDDDWMNFRRITVTDENGKPSEISSLKDFVEYRGGDTSLVVPKRTAGKKKTGKDSDE
ncbi:type II restriction endonuclease [Desulfonema ishimotonii]|nr:type II restriction endonuclease [Desulfonema ishimotonii]